MVCALCWAESCLAYGWMRFTAFQWFFPHSTPLLCFITHYKPKSVPLCPRFSMFLFFESVEPLIQASAPNRFCIFNLRNSFWDTFLHTIWQWNSFSANFRITSFVWVLSVTHLWRRDEAYQWVDWVDRRFGFDLKLNQTFPLFYSSVDRRTAKHFWL